MIKAILTNKRLEANGHAPRPPGAKENLVCAAVSTLAQATRIGLTEIAGMTLTKSEEASGHFVLEWDELNHDGRVILETYLYSMRDIAESYPGTIEITSEL